MSKYQSQEDEKDRRLCDCNVNSYKAVLRNRLKQELSAQAEIPKKSKASPEIFEGYYDRVIDSITESLILAQDERWRRV